jgi:glycosyltransferase involved in cell wall biosynthesis
MHILWVNDHADFTGGCERYIADMVTKIKSMGIRSTLLYQVGSPISPDFTQLFEGCFPVVDLPNQLENLKPDLIYVHSVNSADTIKQLVKCEIPSIRFFHDQKTFCLREHKYTAIGHKTCNKPVSNACYSCLGFVKKSQTSGLLSFKSVKTQKQEIDNNRGFDHFVVGSNYMKSELAKHGFPVEKITVASLFSKAASNSPESSLAKRYRVHPLQILFVGQLIRGKGLDTLLEAMANSTEHYQLVVCGQGKMEAEYKAQALKLGISSRVHFMGRMSQDSLKMQYRQSAAVVIPARAPETFCLVGLEALLEGTPVIATNVGGMSEWFKPGYNGLEFPPNNATALTDAMDQLLGDQDLQISIRNNIKNDSYEKFGEQYHTRILCKLFDQVKEA